MDGQDYTCTAYQALPSKADRQALRDEATSRCGAANQKLSEATKKAQEPLRVVEKAARDALLAEPRFAKRYRGRAADIRREIKLIRNVHTSKMIAVREALPSIDGCTYPAAVFDVFHVWEEACETTYECFSRLVSNHDWYYGYSDDHRVWSAGERSAQEIKATLESLKEEGQEEAAQLLYNQKCPWLNDDGSENKD